MPPADPIVSDNILAVSAIYFSALLEDLKAYEVADRLLALFAAGQLPIGTTGAGNVLYDYWRTSPDRITAQERRSLYAQVLGLSGGDPGVVPNEEFNGLWLRFVAAVSEFARGHAGGVQASATDLARNISQHSAGIHAAAVAVTDRVRDLLVVLSDPDIQRAFGVQGIWQLIDRVASLDLGGAHAVAPRVAMAGSARVIFAWLAGQAPTFSLTDTDDPLVSACERWLAASPVDSQPRPDGGLASTLNPSEAVTALFSKNPAFGELPPDKRRQIAHDTTRVASYLLAIEPPQALAELVAAVDFPEFVRQLIQGVFESIVDASVRQLDAYAELVAAVAASVDQFRNRLVSDETARATLCRVYPPLCESDKPHEKSLDAIAAGRWRRFASSRQQLLATLVLASVTRITRSHRY